MPVRAAIAAAAIAGAVAACGGRPSATPPPVATEGARGCRFTLLFRDFRAAMPDVVGECTENERLAPNGDVEQRTTNGMLVQRRSDGYIAFTDGQQTWVRGPNGLEERPNGQRLPWEGLAPPSPTAGSPVATGAVASPARTPEVGRPTTTAAAATRAGAGAATKPAAPAKALGGTPTAPARPATRPAATAPARKP